MVHIMRHTNMSLVGRAQTGGSGHVEARKLNASALLENPAQAGKKIEALRRNADQPEDNPVLLSVAAAAAAEAAGGGSQDLRRSNKSTSGALGLEPQTKISKKHLTLDEIFTQFEEAVGVKRLLVHSNFVAVNLYSRSIFGEDILANVSIEQIRDANGIPMKISGSVRLRSRAQGIALSLGDKISAVQR